MDKIDNGYSIPAFGTRARLPAERLTPRQREVLLLLCEGLSNKQIGEKLGIACGTVKVHIAGLLRTLNVASRLEAATAARSMKLLSTGNDRREAPWV